MMELALATSLAQATTFDGAWLHATTPIARATCVLLNVPDDRLFAHFHRVRLRATPEPHARLLNNAPSIMVEDAPVVRSGAYTRIRRYEGGYAWLPSWRLKPYADPADHTRCVPAMISDGGAGIAVIRTHPDPPPAAYDPYRGHSPVDRAHLNDGPVPHGAAKPLLLGELDEVRPLRGFACRDLALTESEVIHNTKVVLEHERPDGKAPVMGFLPLTVIVRDPVRVVDGFAQIMNYDGTVGWARRSELEASSGPTRPYRCIPLLMTDNFAGITVLDAGERP